MQPYLGVGVGVRLAEHPAGIVNRTLRPTRAASPIAPELGILFNVAPRLGLYLSGRYQLNLATIPGAANPQWASAMAGIAYYY